LLLQNGVQLEERDYFKNPFSESEIRELAQSDSISAMFARRSPSLKKLGLADKELSDAEMVSLMLQEPRLVRRPLVIMDGKMLVGANIKAVEAALAE
jgi:arsenate reductase-like glutaredoxin family protein